MPAAAPLAATLASTAAAAGTMATIAKGVVLASTAIGVVGMATGSKTLQKIGAIGGAVGGVMTGVGMLASPGASLGQAAMGINSTTRGAEGLLGGAPTTPDTPLTVVDVMKSTPISQIGEGIGSVAAPIGDLGASFPETTPSPSLSSSFSPSPSLSSSFSPSPSPSPAPAPTPTPAPTPAPTPSQDAGSLFDRVQNNLKKYDTAITVLGGMASGFQQHQQLDVQRQAHKDNIAVQRERLQLEREREEERRRNASGAPQIRALGSINAPGDPGIRTYQGPAAPAAGLLAVPQ